MSETRIYYELWCGTSDRRYVSSGRRLALLRGRQSPDRNLDHQRSGLRGKCRRGRTHTLCDLLRQVLPSLRWCGRIIPPRPRVLGQNDNAYCMSCWDEHSEVIHEYSYTPDLVFFTARAFANFGVELEIDDGGTVNSNAQKLLDIANKDAKPLHQDRRQSG